MMKNYELIIIGGGPGGYHAADLAGKAGLNTLVIEKHRLGGVCLNEGCIPSKALLNSAKQYTYATQGEPYGIQAKDVTFHLNDVVQRKNQVVKALVAGVGFKMKSAKVTVLEGTAEVIKKENEMFVIQVGEEVVRGERLVVATGSTPILPPIEGVEAGLKANRILTSKEILDLTELPKQLVVIGGGVIGLEMASYFAQIGSQVTVVEMQPTIGGTLDLDIANELKKTLEKQGITFILNAKVTKVDTKEVIYNVNDKNETIPFDKVLLSVGRKANTQGLGLDNINVELTKGGAIITDSQMKTNIANVYAIGDVNGQSMLAHTAYKEAEVCVNNILGKADHIQYEHVPSVIYTHPEVGSVGYTEAEAKAKGYDIKVSKLPVSYSGRHLAESNDKSGLIKLIVDQKKQTLIGAHICALYASEIILFLSAMMQLEIQIETLKQIIYPHPTVGELIKDALFHL
ncbi:MAG: dihydrolipoyl dehydrogenase [Acholeplasmataceae bacterium]|nr:dihydrolipoyl dehydrogenase [Acholeplasmataceae bacterium]